MGLLYSVFYDAPEKTRRVTFNTKASLRNPSDENGNYIVTEIDTKPRKKYKTPEERAAGIREGDILFVFMHLINDWLGSGKRNDIIVRAIRKATETRSKKTDRIIEKPSTEELIAQCNSLIDQLATGNVTLVGRAGRMMVQNTESATGVDITDIKQLRISIRQTTGTLVY